MRKIALAALMSVAMPLFPGVAAEPPPVELRAALLLRVLAYDRNLATRSGSELRIAVVAGPNGQDAEDMAEALDDLSQVATVAGLPVRVFAHRYQDPESIAEFARTRAISVIYLSQGLDEVAHDVSPHAESLHAVLVAYDGATMANGCALGFTLDGRRTRVVVDLRHAEAAGMDLDAALLRLAVLARGDPAE